MSSIKLKVHSERNMITKRKTIFSQDKTVIQKVPSHMLLHPCVEISLLEVGESMFQSVKNQLYKTVKRKRRRRVRVTIRTWLLL